MTKQQILESMAAEFRIIRHLATKLPPGSLDWRPTAAQRSTIELLGYLTNGPLELARMMVSGRWDVAALAPPPSVTHGAFDAAMAAQETELRRALAPFDDRAFAERPALLPNGATTSLGAALVETTLKALVAYRMQLFLYAKASGNGALTTMNCWYGVDAR